eukprot:CAMPEP_0170560168 /NCGR_PEP_ID=MMETSP0211-20121228/47271_1 /TAXON_ID=311385 /ORGANISM="Pseudokeronopsis sp., Strain OXSARD2" /LENGTH=67 /DNA_ID=CAMNT_0010874021 /DNA_START=857 /DNA_END=1060 /DNA_ORIENTATION=+
MSKLNAETKKFHTAVVERVLRKKVKKVSSQKSLRKEEKESPGSPSSKQASTVPSPIKIYPRKSIFLT